MSAEDKSAKYLTRTDEWGRGLLDDDPHSPMRVSERGERAFYDWCVSQGIPCSEPNDEILEGGDGGVDFVVGRRAMDVDVKTRATADTDLLVRVADERGRRLPLRADVYVCVAADGRVIGWAKWADVEIAPRAPARRGSHTNAVLIAPVSRALRPYFPATMHPMSEFADYVGVGSGE